MKYIRLLSVTLLLALVACGQPAGNGEPVKIGLITPLTGEIAALGVDISHGAELKLAEMNAAGGIQGRLVQLVMEDGRCSGADAAAAIQKLINIDHVVAVHGAGCSSESLAAAPIAEAAGIVLMSPSSSNPDLTSAGDFFFRTYPSDDLKTTAMAQYFAQEGFKKVAILSEDTDFCQGVRMGLLQKLDEGAVVFDEVVDPNTKDFRSLLTRLKKLDFDVLVANPQTPPTGAAMLQQMREAGFQQLVISHDVMDNTVVLELASEAAEGFQVINVPTVASEAPFGQKFIAVYGEPQANMAWGAYGYDTLGVLAQAIEKAGTDGAAMRDYLYALDSYPAVVGDISFDENGDVLGIHYALREVQDGAFVQVADIAVE
ncbi:hypothetical protein COU76_05730 [Candidatus Peregrinibacteria bacterium CG10_big_fil_rev_8_21_14_0_10_49_10]|nr:MAG: hypothetical protein COU76_05730 [Candidatus Peregrinibacteria bacterium CG10_big_fil_rev_8_21_14_0_10_49_10]